MPYIPPSGTLDPEIKCMLIFFPDAEEYQRALFGQLAQLTNVWTWEADRESQAIIRQVWLEAERQTLECFDMACLTDILAVLEEIRDAPCCPAGTYLPPPTVDGTNWDTTGLPGDIPTDDIDVGVGDPPVTEWTDPTGTGITWDDYQSYLCGAANVYLDGVLATALGLKYLSTGVLGIAQLASYYFDTASDILGFNTPLWLNSELLLYVNSWLSDWGNENWDDIISDIGAARTELVCALSQAANATAAASAFITALGNLGLSAPVIAAIGFPASMLNLMYQGGIRAEYAECNCAYDVDVTFTFDADLQDWAVSFARIEWNATEQAIQMHPKGGNAPNPVQALCQDADVAALAGVTAVPWSLAYLSADLYEDPANPGFARDRTVSVIVTYQDDTTDTLTPIASADGTYIFAGYDPAKQIRTSAGGASFLSINAYHNDNSENGVVFLDNVRIGLNAFS